MADNSEIASILEKEDHPQLVRMAGARVGKVLRYLTGRLYSADPEEKWRAVRAIGAVVAEQEVCKRRRVNDLLQRFFWSLNDESGVVPYGVPEAIGEILVQRPEFQEQFLPLLCSMITHEEMNQTGPIERGVIWALGRVGEPVAICSPHSVKGIRHAAWSHSDEPTREVATWALGQIQSVAGDAPPGEHEGIPPGEHGLGGEPRDGEGSN